MITRHILAAAFLAAVSAAQAVPFAITYHGTIGTSDIPDIHAGEPYSITYILDNQGSSASGQTWTGTDLTCTVLRFNTGATTRLAVDLVAAPPTNVQGQLQTDMTGTMTEMFRVISIASIQAGQYSTTGLSLQPSLVLWARHPSGNSQILRDGTDPYRLVTDAADGVLMNPGGWSSPVQVTGPCDDTPLAPMPPRPGAPTSATAQAGNGQVTVSWQAPAGSAAPLRYTAYATNALASCSVDHPTTSCIVAPLINDSTYTFEVTATGPRGRPSSPSNQVTATPRATPDPGGVQAVPALGLPALALLGMGAAGLGALWLRRRAEP